MFLRSLIWKALPLAEAETLSPSRSCPTQLANTSRSPKQRRSTWIGNDRRLYYNLNYAALPHSQSRVELQRLPQAKLTEGVSIDDFSTWRAVRFADPDEIG